MKKTVMAMALLGLLILVASPGRVEGTTDNTYVNNLSSKWIRASTSYNFPFSHSDFQDRLISPNTYQSDSYSDVDCHNGGNNQNKVNVLLWIDGSPQNNQTAVVSCDISVVGVDNNGATGVDVYISAYGYIGQPIGSVLVTLYP